MKQFLIILMCLCMILGFCGCRSQNQAQIITTTLPVYEFTSALCGGTGLSVDRLVTQNVSCLHDYSLQTNQMRMIEGAELLVISGGGLENFLEGMEIHSMVIDASSGIDLHCGEHSHEGHSHEHDPHYWLSPVHAKSMVQTICTRLAEKYPEHRSQLKENEVVLLEKLDTLEQ